MYQPGELEGGKRRATDPIWSVDIHKIDYHIITQGIRVYYLKAPAPKRGFVKEELLIVPDDTIKWITPDCLKLREKIRDMQRQLEYAAELLAGARKPYAYVVTPSGAMYLFVSRGESVVLFTVSP